jgi:hypothetical protein
MHLLTKICGVQGAWHYRPRPMSVEYHDGPVNLIPLSVSKEMQSTYVFSPRERRFRKTAR